MDARCPLCTSVFKTERTGVQFCPNCGQQVNVADVSGAAPPPPVPPTGSGPGPNFGGPYSPPPPPPPTRFGRGPTPWERRSELGVVSAFFQTWKEVMTDPAGFFSRAQPSAPIWDAILYAWIVSAFSALINLPVNLLTNSRGMPSQDLSQMTPQMREQMERMMELLQIFQNPKSLVAYTVFNIVFYPIAIILSAALIHLFCLMWGASKNGFGATVRVLCYASSPMLAGFWFLMAIAIIYVIVVEIIGFMKMQETSGGRAAGVVFSPVLLCCCCFCLAGVFAGMAAASGVK